MPPANHIQTALKNTKNRLWNPRIPLGNQVSSQLPEK